MADSITAAVAGSAVGWSPRVPTRSLDIDAFERMLLTADGTVTTLLEVCTGAARAAVSRMCWLKRWSRPTACRA